MTSHSGRLPGGTLTNACNPRIGTPKSAAWYIARNTAQVTSLETRIRERGREEGIKVLEVLRYVIVAAYQIQWCSTVKSRKKTLRLILR